MRLFAALILSVAALAACKPPGQTGQAPGARVDPHALQIEIGRYGVMLQQTGQLTSTQIGAPDASAQDAKELGLVNQVFADHIFNAEVAAYVDVFAKVSKSAVSLTKTLLYQTDGMAFYEALETGADVNVIARMTEDCQKGIERFLKKD